MAPPKFNPSAPYDPVQFDPKGDYSSTDASPAPAGPDFTNPHSEGLYAMKGPSGTAQVPYSKVTQAIQGGYAMAPDVLKRYTADLRAAGPKHLGPLDSLAQKAQDALPYISPDQSRTDPRFQQYDTFKNHPELARTVTNAGTGMVKLLAQMPAEFVDWFNLKKQPLTPGQSAQQMQERAAGGTKFDPNTPITQADINDYLAEKTGQVGAGLIAGETIGLATRGLIETATKAREGVRTGTQSLMGAGGRAVSGEVASASEAAKTADEAHQAKTQDALHETAGKELKSQQDAKTAQETAERASKEQTAKQIADRDKAIQDRSAAEDKLTAEKLKQGKIGPTQAKLQNAWSKLRAQVETAREKALKVGNEKYNGVNEKLNPLSADMEAVHDAYQESSSSVSDVQAEPPLLKRLGTSIERGDALTYKDEQALYSELGKELSKGTLQGPVYHAYDVLHDRIGADMQRIADSQGAGAQLLDARNYWRRMKQTFGKPLAITDAASKALKGDVATQDAFQNQMRMLGSFDPEIPKQATYVQSVGKGVESLPNSTSERVLAEKAKLPPIPSRGKPVTVEPAPVAAPERAPLPDRPEPTSVDTKALREKLVDRWASGESSLNKWQVRALLAGGLSAVIDSVGLLGGHSPGIGSMALEAGGTAAYTFGPAMVAKLLEKPGFREWITRPPAGELETLSKLPNADRIKITDGLQKVVKQAQSQGIKVDPKLAALVGAGASLSGPKTQALQKKADDARQTAAQ